MHIIYLAGKYLNSILRQFGYEIRTFSKNRLDISMQATIARRLKQGLVLNSIIDVGASNGSWSNIVKKYYKNSNYLLIEANGIHENELIKFKNNNTKVEYIIAAAGDYIGNIYFDSRDPFGGLASHTPNDTDYISVPVTTIDTEVKRINLSPPFLIKLDTHGFEIPILKGAEQTLKNTNLIIIEAYNFQLTSDSLRFWELCSYMNKLGFQPIDFCDPMHRPKDQAFWQMDVFFIPNTDKEFESNDYN